MYIRILTALIFVFFTLPNANSQQATDSVAPEPASPKRPVKTKPVIAKNWMISAANPLAVKAGASILRKGGTAADAAIAVQLVLGLVEPQSSGLGGGAFVIYFDAASGKLTTLDGRETAPMAATPRLFQDDKGEPLKFYSAVVGGRSVGVPGTPKLLEELHSRWGKAPWPSLFNDAIALSANGFQVSPRLERLVRKDLKRLGSDQVTSAYFMPNGKPITAGDILKNPVYAESLKIFAAEKSAPFYRGKIANSIVEKIRNAKKNPGIMLLSDLARYQIKQRPPVCVVYRAHKICGMGPPSSGGLTVGQILGILQSYDLKSLGPDNPQSWRLIGDASRLAFADRGRYMADIDYVPLPLKGLIDPVYLAERSKLLQGRMSLKTVLPGTPKWDHAQLYADDEAIELPSTSHFSIVDQYGNALSMTTTIENGFGSRLMTNGFLLNNELTDFSFRSHKDGIPIANRVEPGKRPRSSMAPTIVMKDGKPRFVIGSPGGSRIIGYVAKTIIAWLDWDMNVQEAINLPHMVNRFGIFDIEKNAKIDVMKQMLRALGYFAVLKNLNSGLHGIEITPDGLQGGADNRREGIAYGE